MRSVNLSHGRVNLSNLNLLLPHGGCIEEERRKGEKIEGKRTPRKIPPKPKPAGNTKDFVK